MNGSTALRRAGVVFVVSIVAAVCAVAPAAAPTPPWAPTAQQPDARQVLVWVGTQFGAPDPSGLLVSAWERATGGRGHLRLVDSPGEADAVVMVFPGPGFDSSWAVNERQRAIVIYTGSAPVQRFGVAVILHEISHLWCCPEGPARDGHWADDAEPGLMNASTYGLEAGLFSERELRVLRLIVPSERNRLTSMQRGCAVGPPRRETRDDSAESSPTMRVPMASTKEIRELCDHALHRALPHDIAAVSIGAGAGRIFVVAAGLSLPTIRAAAKRVLASPAELLLVIRVSEIARGPA